MTCKDVCKKCFEGRRLLLDESEDWVPSYIRCSIALRAIELPAWMVPYPPSWCPWRAELLMLCETDNDHPESAFLISVG